MEIVAYIHVYFVICIDLQRVKIGYQRLKCRTDVMGKLSQIRRIYLKLTFIKIW